MRSRTPTKSKSPFSINRKSQIPDTSSFISKQNSQITLNKRLDNTCQLSRSRPMIEVDGNLIDASTVLKQKQSMIADVKNNSKKLQMEVNRKNKIISNLENQLAQRDDLINRLEAQKQSMGDAFAMMQTQTLEAMNLNQSLTSQNAAIKRQLSQKCYDMQNARDEIQQLKFNLQVYSSLDPRLKELQELQDNLIEENTVLKQNKEQYVSQLRLLIKEVKQGTTRLDAAALQSLLNSI